MQTYILACSSLLIKNRLLTVYFLSIIKWKADSSSKLSIITPNSFFWRQFMSMSVHCFAFNSTTPNSSSNFTFQSLCVAEPSANLSSQLLLLLPWIIQEHHWALSSHSSLGYLWTCWAARIFLQTYMGFHWWLVKAGQLFLCSIFSWLVINWLKALPF